MTVPGGSGSSTGGSQDKTFVPGEEQDAASTGPVGQPQGGQGDLSAEIERGERGTQTPAEDMGEGDSKPFYAS